MNKVSFSFFNIPNLFTTANFVCGIISILFTISGRVDLAPYPLLLAVFFDFFDGFFARLLNISGELGKQLDSFADIISFGLAPGMIMLHFLIESLHFQLLFDNKYLIINWFNSLSLNNWSLFIPFISFLIPIFSMFRLAKFNLDKRQSDQFIGLPTPANAMFFCMFPLVSKIDNSFNSFLFSGAFLSSIILLFSVLLISEIPLFSLKFKNFKWSDNKIRFLFLIISCFVIFFFSFWSLGIIVFLYLLMSVIQILIDKNKKNEI
ncbi:MAG: CDP-alcohol phosphatidyltransferase family protein [Flavobacteriia bacterium]|nr:CDP-alcohol phosphatidyltransferase family protein [Flavobacteriia bacterium]